MDAIQLRKEVVRPVKDVVGFGLHRDLPHRLGVMNRRRGNMEKSRHLGFNIVESMDFYPALSLPELRPAEDREAEFDGCGIECVDSSAKVEYLRNIQITSLFHHVVGELLKDAIIPVLVRFCQVATSYRVSETEELRLAAVSLNRYYQVSQTFSSGELAEHKNFQLIPA